MSDRDLKILVLDDEPEIVRIMVDWLFSREYQAAGITRPSELLKTLEANSYDVVLLDIHMPGANGLDLIGPIKKVRPEATVIVVSASVSDEIERTAKAAGAEFCFSKPVDLHSLVKILDTF